MTHWSQCPQLVLDTESTGLDLENDRIVQVAAVQLDTTGVKRSLCHIINPGIDIPQGATDVHGITNERARAEGLDPVAVIPRIVQIVENAWRLGTPVVAMNASFDITLLDRELRRHAGRGLDLTGALVLDPLVIDRACDPWRPGKRKLENLAAHYQVKVTDAHDALGDCLTAARVVWRQARIGDVTLTGPNGRTRRADYSPLRQNLPDLHRWQAEQHREWAEGYERHLRDKKGQVDAVVDGSWPWRPVPHERERAAS